MEKDLGKLPRWSVANVYPSLESREFEAALAELDRWIDEHDAALDRDGIGGKAAAPPSDEAALARAVEGYLERANRIRARLGTLDAFIYAYFSTNTKDEVARRRMSELEPRGVRVEATGVRFRTFARHLDGKLDALCARSDAARAHRFFLEEAIEDARHMMSEPEEMLASALSPSGASAWSRLHQTITSQIEVPLERDGKVEMLPMSKVRSLAAEADPELRRRAYEAELEAWRKWQEPCAAALNGIKGWSDTLLRRRGYAAAIEPAIEQARIDQATLDALLASMRRSLPDFRRYLKAKARALGKERLAWYDVQAPVGKADRVWKYEDATRFVVECFGRFSKRLADYAQRAFDGDWVDAGSRPGKVGGAFCMGVPEVKESRVLMNFDGTFDQVSTLAHELGHGYHNECLKDRTPLLRATPMTLAETASIFCETIVFNAALAKADAKEALGIIETSLLGSCQVVVDILSRYLFETRVFERRAKSELTSGDLCALMTEAQKETYGDALDPERLHPYMWAVKGHYYSAEMGFYNYPYAFGLLFGLGLYSIYRARGEAFCAEYDELLSSTGLGKAAELAARFKIDIRSQGFWDGALDEVRKLIARYETLV
jgi:pepF/M3 family oligoendopeptidase